MTAEQILRLFVKGLFERKGIDKNLWVKKFIKNIVYSKEEIVLTLYYKRSFSKNDFDGNGSGYPHPAAAISRGLVKEKRPTFSEASFKLAPLLSSERTIDIILPNTIHGCKKKDL